jgi:hypothetical protein
MKKIAIKIIATIILSVITVSGSIFSLDKITFSMTSQAEPVEIICPVASINYGKCHLKHIIGDSWICVYSGYTTDFCAQPENSN